MYDYIPLKDIYHDILWFTQYYLHICSDVSTQFSLSEREDNGNGTRKQESARGKEALARDEVQDLAAAAPAGPRPQHRAAARALLEAAYVRLHII